MPYFEVHIFPNVSYIYVAIYKCCYTYTLAENRNLSPVSDSLCTQKILYINIYLLIPINNYFVSKNVFHISVYMSFSNTRYNWETNYDIVIKFCKNFNYWFVVYSKSGNFPFNRFKMTLLKYYIQNMTETVHI